MGEIIDSPVFSYGRKAYYYETDQMGIVHHSNYIRWMEEARIAYMEFIGLPYAAVEAKKILIPVVSAHCEYKNYVRFDECVEIIPEVAYFNGVRMTIHYRMIHKETKKLCAIGQTTHCFTSPEMKPLSLKKADREMYEIFLGCTVAGKEESTSHAQ